MYKKEKKEHAFRTFSRDINEDNIPGVLFMYGTEGYLIDWAAETLVKKYVDPACLSLDYVKFQDEGEDIAQLLGACETLSMFSRKRIIWAREFGPLRSGSARGFTKDDAARLGAYLNEPNPASILIFSAEQPEEKSELVKMLKKSCRCYVFDPLDYATLSGFIRKRFSAAGAVIDGNQVRTLIDQTGYFNREGEYHIYNLVNDIDKIAAFCEGGRITDEAIEEMISGDADKFIFDLLDAVCAGQKDRAFELLYPVLDAAKDEFSVVAMLVNQFELLLDVAEFREDGMNLQQIVSAMKGSEYRIKKAMSFTEKFTVDKLKSILSQLYEIDRNTKMGLMEPKLALELLIGRI